MLDLSAIFFEKAGRRVGSLSVNIIRIFLGILFLGITTLFTRGMFFPMDATPYNWFWLGLSGVIGFSWAISSSSNPISSSVHAPHSW